jgi:LPXTG-motif cell wall-anchored protein
MIKRVLILMCALFVVLAPAGVASAQTYPPPPGGITPSDPTPDPGQTITVTATACAPGATVRFYFNGELFAEAVADEDGVATVQLTIPADAVPGVTYTIQAVGCRPEILSTTVTIPGGGLPVTGSNSTFPLTKLGIALIGAGSVLALVARRQRTSKVAA